MTEFFVLLGGQSFDIQASAVLLLVAMSVMLLALTYPLGIEVYRWITGWSDV